MKNPNIVSEDIVFEENAVAILNYVDKRLREWAHWAISGIRLGTGYPPCSLEYRLMMEGHVIREYLGSKPTSVFPEAEEIEYFIREIAIQQNIIAKVIRAHYLEKGTMTHKVRQLGISVTQFKIYVLNCRWWLAGRLASDVRVRKYTANRC